LLVYVLSALVAGSLVYCALTIAAARSYLATRPAQASEFPPISILTPLAGADLGLEANLRSSFLQKYPNFEIVLAVRHDGDPAIPVVRNLMAEFPRVPARLIVTGEPTCPNAKVYSLARMTEAARHDLLVMNDSDIRTRPDMLATIAAEFADPAVALATCPYCAIAGKGWPSRLEALGMNTQFMAGVFTARMIEGVKFALGPSAVVRRSALERIGGWPALDSYLAEDFVLGKRIAEEGYGAILSSVRVEHHIGDSSAADNLAHRLRWVRSTRRSRPKGYVGELFTNPLPLALLLTGVDFHFWPWLAASAVLRGISAWAVARWVLRDAAFWRLCWAIPVQDLIAFLVWIAGFFGNRVTWRGRTYYLHRDGRFELVPMVGQPVLPSAGRAQTTRSSAPPE